MRKYCTKPFQYLEISSPKGEEVDCYACCPTILPKKMGDLSQAELDEVWNSKNYEDVRASILDGSFRYCNKELCPEIQSDNLVDLGTIEDSDVAQAIASGKTKLDYPPREINLSYDLSCNLACPSCRSDFNTTPSVKDDEKMEQITDELMKANLSGTRLIACSSGDPFVSRHFRNLLFNLNGDDHPGLKVQIMTNAILLNESTWKKMHKIQKQIDRVCVSIDAASDRTYQITRKGGHWETLMKNLEFLSELKRKGELPFLRIDFVVQDHNFHEMVDFIKLGEKFDVSEVFFQKITNWGTFNSTEYKKRAVFDTDHPDHASFKNVLTNEHFRKEIVNPGNLGDFLGKRKRHFNLKNALFHSIRKKWRLIMN